MKIKKTLQLAKKFIRDQGGIVTPKPVNHMPPEEIRGVPVRAIPGTETEYNNQTWITLIPSEGEDSRIWEFSLTTGKIVQTAR